MFCSVKERRVKLIFYPFFLLKTLLIKFFVYICLILIFKTDRMETQRTTLSKEIKSLEEQLQGAVLNADAFEQIAIYRRLEIAKSTLLNLD